ncbi:glycosyltransferase family 8 protein [Lentinula edodes]|uniref:Glycosyltransferase family 8 protein n=1 Tax=Lentinula edodes TaxID=5353 RepID=A0A1Q3EL78_LENED|nr:glycosyltransferase family 8 protein [Lentinula edodes]
MLGLKILGPNSAFGLEGFERVVLLDADMLIKRNMDELLQIPLAQDEIAAAHIGYLLIVLTLLLKILSVFHRLGPQPVLVLTDS